MTGGDQVKTTVVGDVCRSMPTGGPGRVKGPMPALTETSRDGSLAPQSFSAVTRANTLPLETGML